MKHARDWRKAHAAANIARYGSWVPIMARISAQTFREDPLPERPMVQRVDSRGRPISLPKLSFLEDAG